MIGSKVAGTLKRPGPETYTCRSAPFVPVSQPRKDPCTLRRRVCFEPIGRVENEFDEPVEPDVLLAAESRVIIDPEFSEGLTGIEPGQRLMVVFHFHRSERSGYELVQHPRGDKSRPKRGVFALRSPRRPSPVGVSVVEVLEVAGNVIRVRGLDAINGTPVLDLKGGGDL